MSEPLRHLYAIMSSVCDISWRQCLQAGNVNELGKSDSPTDLYGDGQVGRRIEGASSVNRLIARILPVADMLLLPAIYPSAWLLKQIRAEGVHRLPACRKALMKVGVFPVRNHYYEPQFDFRNARRPYSKDRSLPGIHWNVEEQIQMLSAFTYGEELRNIPHQKPDTLEFYFNNGTFEAGDAEYWYQLLRVTKPRRIYEIGSGNSTLMAIKAIQKNREEDARYSCEHVCVEPFRNPWLEQTRVSVVRKRVEELDVEFFAALERNDILFIDSSHVIRPQGDVLFEYLEVLPILKKGVIVHVHDVFSPRDYLAHWLVEEVRLWNEQYLLEAFLSHNESWRIIGACNYLHHAHYEKLKAVAPYLSPENEPGSFYIRKVR